MACVLRPGRCIVAVAFVLLSIDGVRANKQDYYDLHDFLFNGGNGAIKYKKDIMPVENTDEALRISMDFVLLSIAEVDEKGQSLVTTARLWMQWDDYFLSWASDEYGNITEILVPQERVYLPDVVLGNSVSAQKQMGFDELPIRLASDGIITWEPTQRLATDCDIDITYFPFETQKCNIEFETAVSNNFEIDIDVLTGKDAVNLVDFGKNGQWELVGTKAENLDNENGKTKIRFTILIKRRRIFYLLNIILPIFFLSLTASLVFALPADEGEKMGLSITVLLAFAVYLSIVAEIIPNTSLQISILGLYLTVLLGLSSLSTILSVVVIRLHSHGDEPVGSKTTTVFRGLRKILCLGTPSQSSQDKAQVYHADPEHSDKRRSASPEFALGMNDVQFYDGRQSRQLGSRVDYREMERMAAAREANNVPPPTPPTPEPEPMTWPLVAQTLDAIFLFVFSFTTIAITIGCLVYLHVGSEENAPTL